MIGKLSGLISIISTDYIIIDVNDVGYVVYVSDSDIRKISEMNSKITLWIHYSVREDGISLYGFLDLKSKVWFCELIKLNGISGRIAMSIIGNMSTEDIEIGILTKNESLFTSIPSIGKKLANRIVNELSGKSEKVSIHLMSYRGLSPTDHVAPSTQSFDIVKLNETVTYQAIEALSSLGFTSLQANTAIHSVISKVGTNIPVEDLIKLALQEIK